MTDAERNRKLRAAQREAARELPRIQRDTHAEVLRLLKVAQARIVAQLATTPSDFQAFRLAQLRREVQVALGEMGDGAAARLGAAAGDAWQGGIDFVDVPIAAGGVRLAAQLTSIDTEQLLAMRAFMTDRIRDVSVQAINRINSELGLAAIGAQSQSDAVGAITKVLGDTSRARAITITRTELGRAWSVAMQARQEQAVQVLPGLRKQWRRSGKIHSREIHDATDGQVRKVHEPFTLANGVQLMHPRDPAGPAAETINCGCTVNDWMESWDLLNPGPRPFTPEEIQAKARARFAAGRVG